MGYNNDIYHSIKEKVQQLMPAGARVVLFGSQARGDARPDSDWDILILLNQEHVGNEDFSRVAYPLIQLGWDLDASINPILYTFDEWERRNFTPFHKNVEKEGIVLSVNI